MRPSGSSARNLHTFRAPDPRAALDAVRNALGDDAIIVGTREVGGRLWGAPEIEITASRPVDVREPAEPESRLQAEIGSLRRMIDDLRARLPDEPAPARAPVAPELPPLHRHLLARGVDGPLAERLLRHAVERTPPGGDLPGAVRAAIAGQLSTAPAPWRAGDRRIVALVGPTGVGKTTTIAKIAARAILESQRRVALITIDNYRIGAREHLARYGEIMRVPVQVAKDREGLRAALMRVAQAELILVDTAGRFDAETIAAQGALLESIPGVEIALVLSAASGNRDLRAAVARFRSTAPDRLIFTKLDEAAAPGCILAAAMAAQRPVACVADGQRVPDDLHAATPASLTDIVAGDLARRH
jgi:flagellar biosynthesis protein FlhF